MLLNTFPVMSVPLWQPAATVCLPDLVCFDGCHMLSPGIKAIRLESLVTARQGCSLYSCLVSCRDDETQIELLQSPAWAHMQLLNTTLKFKTTEQRARHRPDDTMLVALCDSALLETYLQPSAHDMPRMETPH